MISFNILSPLDRKLFRDLWDIKGQVFAIALVVAAGVATYVLSIAASDSLHKSQQQFYRDFHFAHIFADFKRAPESIVNRLRSITGINQVEGHISQMTRLSVPGFEDSITSQLYSIPDSGRPLLNQLYLRKGRLTGLNSTNEIVISDAFVDAHKLRLGDKISVLINGTFRTMTIVGVALSPEFIYQLSPSQYIPDYKRFAIIWMPQKYLASAYNMQGAINSISLTVAVGADRLNLIKLLDRELARYGSLGAIERKDQLSNRYLTEEFSQLAYMAIIYPIIFLGVAIFLLNIVIGRIVSTQREQIGILKAFGYTDLSIGIHYFKLVGIIVLIGLSVGLVAGTWLGLGMSEMYAQYYRFPKLIYEPSNTLYIVAIVLNLTAAFMGSWQAVRKAVSLTPIEAMRPVTPSVYHKSLVELPVLSWFVSRLTKMIFRNLGARPVKAFLTIVGIAMSCAIMVVANYFPSALDQMLRVQYLWSQQEDLVVMYQEDASQKGMSTIRKIEGVEYVEPFRSVAVKFRNGRKEVRSLIRGVKKNSELKLLIDTKRRRYNIPQAGIVLTSYLAKTLKIKPGDSVDVEFLQGRKFKRKVKVVGVVTEYLGMSGYMSLRSLNRLAGDYRLMNGSYLLIDNKHKAEIIRQLKRVPRVISVSERRHLINNFLETLGETILTFVGFMLAFASIITFGVVYNSAKISLSERSRELASMRVLGFTRGEISYILLGELALLVVISLPVGFVFGYLLCAVFALGLQNELYRIPLYVEFSNYMTAAVAVTGSALVSGLIVRRKLDTLDLVAVLKTKA